MKISAILNKTISKNFVCNYLKEMGITNFNDYINPSFNLVDNPSLYNNIDAVCNIVKKNINKRIAILSDEDVDGLCSSSMLYMFLKNIGNNPIPIFHTASKAHGINKGNGEDKVKDNLPEMDLLLIPDASIDQEMAKQLYQKGVSICELEHHDTKLRDYVTTVNCQYQDETNHYACGTMVTYKFIQRYCELYNINTPNYDDLIAIATVADVMNMTSIENRYYVNQFYENFDEANNNEFVTTLVTKYNKGQPPTQKDIGWRIAPLLNAIYRSGSREDVKNMFYAMVGEKDNEEVIKQLTKVKKEQDKRVKEVVNYIEPKLNHEYKTLFAYIDNDDKSFSGLIANKILGAYNKPTFVLREINSTTYSGSYRSNVPLKDIINESKLAEVSGHNEAAGIVIKKANLRRLQDFLETLDLATHPDIEVTAIVEAKDITVDICQEIADNRNLWGTGIPAPTFYLRCNVSKGNIFVYEKNTTTIKVQLGDLACLKFFANESDTEAFRQYNKFILELVVGNCCVNEWNGDKTPQAEIINYEITPIEERKENWEELF